MFFTVGAVLVLGLVLLFAKVVSDARTEASRQTVSFTRMADLHDSMEDSIAAIITQESGIDVLVGNDSVSFTESLPNGHAAGLQGRLDSFKSFVEGKESAVMLNVDRFNPTFRLTPQNVSYTHTTYGEDILVNGTDVVQDLQLDIMTDESVLCAWSPQAPIPPATRPTWWILAKRRRCPSTAAT